MERKNQPQLEKMKIIGESIDSFRKLRENDAYYIDKSRMIQEYLVDQFKGCVLFARPRRFGKTLTMTMFRDFLDITQNSKSIFAGLEIMKYTDTVEKYMNQYPVVCSQSRIAVIPALIM